MTMVPAPVKHTEKERLGWERELLGLYISAHPLDNYDAYFEEQTVPIVEMTSDIDGKSLTVGGLISSIRSIVTKSGTKMAFMKLEDKTSETEIIVFPNLYEQIGSQLLQDVVVRATGKVSARDKDGNLNSEIKMIADDIQIVDDDELRNYEANGRKMAKPKPRAVKATRTKSAESSEPAYTATAVIEAAKKLYIHVKDPDDAETLMKIKQICANFVGFGDIVLVLGEDKKSAIKMPFKVDSSIELIGELVKVLGEDAVALK
jgi:DNA polymerase-3 subunit alpha